MIVLEEVRKYYNAIIIVLKNQSGIHFSIQNRVLSLIKTDKNIQHSTRYTKYFFGVSQQQ